MILFYIVFGVVFGWTLSRSGAADYNYIQGMFLFEEFQLYGIMGVAVCVTAPGLLLLKRYGKDSCTMLRDMFEVLDVDFVQVISAEKNGE